MQTLSIIDFGIVFIYLIFCLALGLKKGFSIKNLRQFAVGSQNAKAVLLSCVIFATINGAGSTIDMTGRIYVVGVFYAVIHLLAPVYWLISIKIFGANIERFAGHLTISHIIKTLYGRNSRWIVTILSIVVSMSGLAVQTLAIGHIFNYFFGLTVFQGVVIAYGILTIYSAAGGIRAVVVTEVFQFIIFFLVIPISLIFVFINSSSNITSLIHDLPIEHVSFEFTKSNIIILISFILYTLIPDTSPHCIQRYLMAANAKELSKSFMIIAIISIPFGISMCLIAYLLKATAPHLNPADALFYFTDQLPVGVKGLMVAGLLAIVMSTAESWINSSAIILVHDVVKQIIPSLGRIYQLILVRVFTVLIAVSSACIVATGSEIFNLIWIWQNLWVPIITIPLCAGFLGLQSEGRSFIVSTIFAVIFCIIGRRVTGEFGSLSLCAGLAGSAIGFFGNHYWWVLKTSKASEFATIGLSDSLAITIPPEPQLNLKYYVKKFIRATQNHFKHETIRDSAFAGFTMFYFFFYSLMLTNSPAHTILAVLIISGYILCGLILMKDIFFSKAFIKKYLHPYFYLAMIFCLPMTASFMLFANRGDDFWTINAILSAASVFFFLNAFSSMVVITVGILLGYFLLFAGSGYIGSNVVHNSLTVAYIYIFFLCTALLFLRPKEKHHQEKIDVLQMIGGTIAHEARSPIASITMAADTLQNTLKRVTTGVKVESGLYHLMLTEEDYKFILYLCDNIQLAGKKGLKTVDSILLMMRNSIIEGEKHTYFVSEILRESVEEFTLYDHKARNIEINLTKDFKIYCVLTALKHVFFNLLKNAYKHGGGDVMVKIYNKESDLYFVDNGKGISEDALPKIFGRFYTKSKDGTGLGLAYCQMVMEALGGHISCESKLGKYTKFILSFPKIAED